MEISVLIEKAQAGDASARKILIEENLGLVHHCETVCRAGIRGGGSVPDRNDRTDESD